MEAYKERFIKEFWELNERVTKLGDMLTKYDNGTLDFYSSLSYQYAQNTVLCNGNISFCADRAFKG